MAQTKRKRRTKHRGNAAGIVEHRGRTSRPPSPEERKKAQKQAARSGRFSKPPTWGSAATRALVMIALFIPFVLRADGSDKALVVDPGDEPDLLLGAIEQLDATVEAILLTHTDIDHVGAVAPLAKATGAPVYCPKAEVARLQDIMGHAPMEGLGPYEGYDPEHTVEGGEELTLADLRIEVVATPAQTEGHMTY